MPIILATQEAEIRRIKVHSQHAQTVSESLSQKRKKKKKSQKRASEVAQGVGPEFKFQYWQKKKKK
jgi:hypothetical protein